MSYRYNNAFIKPGLNTLTSPPASYTYELWSWGTNQLGQLGIGNSSNYSSPKQIGTLTDWASVSSGAFTSVAVKTNGTLWSWGANSFGELGLGNRTNYSSPKQVGSLTNWLRVSCGQSFTAAVKTDGTLWAWGANSSGKLGLGNTTDYSSPKQVGSLTNWLRVSCGEYYALAVKTDGTLWAWGANNSGQLGTGNATGYSSPKQIGLLTNWLYVSASGYRSSLAVKTDGTLWAWGYNNSYGQLGLGNTTNYSSPKQVGSLTNWATISCGTYYSLAIKTDNTLWSWGRNVGGQLGLGNTTNYSSPKQIGSLTNWSKVSAGGSFSVESSLAIKIDGTLWSWGTNTQGQLGLGNGTSYSSPKQVGSLTGWYFLPNRPMSTWCLSIKY